MQFKVLLFLILFIPFFNSCGSSSSSSTSQTFTLEEKKFVHELFLTEYLWYDDVPSTINYAQYNEPQEMINTLRVTPPDLWSFTLTEEEYENFANQQTIGFGFGYTSDLQIFLVRIDSPAYGKLQRGDQIVEVNQQSATSTLIKEASQNVDQATQFKVIRNGTVVETTVTPQEYSFKVSLGKIITQENKKIGYLRYDSFTESSVNEFEAIFTNFHNENINELVIDLRYNGGGSLSTASVLLDNITNAYPGNIQIYLDWNDKNQNRNSIYAFEERDFQDGNELTMQRVIFLVTKDSASASEALINALKPYLGENNIITIGENTHGKPVGMSGRAYGINYYFLINFFVKNSADQTSSFEGIAPTCSAEDDITHLMGDENETMFATALYYIQNNRCP